MRLLTALTLFVILAGCSDHYNIKGDRVEFVDRRNFGIETSSFWVSGVDVDSFEALSEWFAKDKKRVYWKGRVLRGADPSTIGVLNNYFAIDKDHVFGFGEIILGANPDSFELLEGNWSKDATSYFYSNKKVDVCDYDSFRIIDEFTPFRAIDDRCYYWETQIVSVEDFSTLEILQGGYAADQFAVYFSEWKIPSADVHSFEVKEDRFLSLAKDRNRCYLGPRVLECKKLEKREDRRFCGCEE
jgi:hypothetical protein